MIYFPDGNLNTFISGICSKLTLYMELYWPTHWFTAHLSLSLPEHEIGMEMTYGPVGGAPMSIPAFKDALNDISMVCLFLYPGVL